MYIQNDRKVFFQAHSAAIAGMQRVTLRGRVVYTHGGAWLHRHAGHALHPGVDFRDVRGACKSGGGGCLVADIGVYAHIRFRAVP